MVTVTNVQYAILNDKRFYFSDKIVSLLFTHYLLEDARKLTEKLIVKIQNEINSQKYKFLREKAKSISKCERLRIIRSILTQPPLYHILKFKSFIKTRFIQIYQRNVY